MQLTELHVAADSEAQFSQHSNAAATVHSLRVLATALYHRPSPARLDSRCLLACAVPYAYLA